MTRRAAHYTPRIAKMICAEIAMGASLKKALDKVGYLAPTMPTLWRWLDEHADFREMYDRARQLQADTDADEMRRLGEEVRTNTTLATAYRVAIDVLKWQAEMRNPTKYSSKADGKAPQKAMNAEEKRAEIARLQAELGIAEAAGVKVITLVKEKKAA